VKTFSTRIKVILFNEACKLNAVFCRIGDNGSVICVVC
jgi:hypothetical protein